MGTIVFVCTYLGNRYGGVNVFNLGLLTALSHRADIQTMCVVPSAECVDSEAAGLTRPICLRSEGDEFLAPMDDAILAVQQLAQLGPIDAVVGHDVLTGELALAIAGQLSGARGIVIHHMAYGNYVALMRDAENARDKERRQRLLFPRADQAFGVGPLLLESLRGIERGAAGMPPAKMLLPPLLDVAAATAERPSPKVLYSGRIEDGNDAVKQGRLAARAIGRALRKPNAKMRNATVDIYGFDIGSELTIEFRKVLEQEAGYGIPVKCLSFVDSRQEMLDVVRDASLLVMPSVHEGFGLVAWEAMCLGVPVAVSENSGFFKFVTSLGQSHNVFACEVLGRLGDEEISAQVDALAEQIRSAIEYPIEAHARAAALLQAIRDSGKVESTLRDFVDSCVLAPRTPAFVETELGDPDEPVPDLRVMVDIGCRTSRSVEYRLESTQRRLISVLTAINSGMAGAQVVVSSSYLDKLRDMAKNDPDGDVRHEAAVRYNVDKPKVKVVEKFLNRALYALADSAIFNVPFASEESRASAFQILVDKMNSRRSDGYVLDAVARDPYRTFRVKVSEEVLQKTDFFEPGFTTSYGATLLDLWFDCDSEIAAAYLYHHLKNYDGSDQPLTPMGSPDDWGIGTP
ncbi:glycosyltransferase family 4 protein [Lysobacter enzymogenes]|uniref:glycosyltransferase family 4 protein n=1 Tax=Lysobacter enzymogenes TaxID=69 RepID=UPI003748886E